MNTRTNPYVGPRSFRREEADRFFGREREAQDLLARVLSERLVLFYAQSGAGKSSLVNARLVPGLEEVGFVTLPVGRVSGGLPQSMDAVDNIFAFNLMMSLESGDGDPARLAHLTLDRFLARLASDDGRTWFYNPPAGPGPDLDTALWRMGASDDSALDRALEEDLATLPEGDLAQASTHADQEGVDDAFAYVLIIDQFEEIVSAHTDRWQEREGFFRQLDAAMQADSNLWVVLVLREDYIASLEPYAGLLADRMRARFYMQRMQRRQALDAVARPAAAAGRPFAEGVAEELVDNLSRIQTGIVGKDAGGDGGRRNGTTVAGEFVEPVQLQVVCYQLWQQLAQERSRTSERDTITADDLRRLAGGRDLAQFVDRALADFYESALAEVLADPDVAVSERRLRAWFDDALITEAGTRGQVFRGETQTAGMPDRVVALLANRFLLHTELRAGGAWVELVHDRFVEPIRAANQRWRERYYNPLASPHQAWLDAGRAPARLLRGETLAEAVAFAEAQPAELSEAEKAYLDESVRRAQAEQREAAADARRRRNLIVGAVVVMAVLAALTVWSLQQRDAARAAEERAVAAQATAEANTALANQQLAALDVERLLKEARDRKAAGDVEGAIAAFEDAAAADPNLDLDLEAEIADVRRQVATKRVQEGEALARAGDAAAAEEKFKAALALEPPPDTPVYVYVPAGEFLMGSTEEDELAASDEFRQHEVTLDAYWIGRTEVTNARYGRCVAAGACAPPADGNRRYENSQFARQPVSGVTWFQAVAYAEWVGGRLPSEAEWEKACRGGLEIPVDPLVGWGDLRENPNPDRIYPWGDNEPDSSLLNYSGTGLGIWADVGSYPDGTSPYGVYDLAGNVWEWTADWYAADYYAESPDRNPQGPETGDVRVLRGGSFSDSAAVVRCANRDWLSPSGRYDSGGFRVVWSPGF